MGNVSTSFLALEEIIIEVTQACNHACVHCYNYWSEHRAAVNVRGSLSRSEILRHVGRIRRVTRLKSVAISGGEPLIRRDTAGIVNDLSNEGLDVTVITNGALLTDARLRTFPKQTLFEITLFSSDAKIHDRMAGRPGSFTKVLRGAIAIRKRGCGLAIACVMSLQNLQGLPRTIELALALGADGIALNRVNLTAHTLAIRHQLVPGAAALRTALDSVEEIAEKFGIKIALSVPPPPCVVDPSSYKQLHFSWCPRGGQNAYYTIGYDGSVRPCNHSSVVLGDLRRGRFEEIVTSSRARDFWAPIPPECRACSHPLRDACRGGCPAASHECYGTRERIDPFVELAAI